MAPKEVLGLSTKLADSTDWIELESHDAAGTDVFSASVQMILELADSGDKVSQCGDLRDGMISPRSTAPW